MTVLDMAVPVNTGLHSFLAIDEACVAIFPLLIEQLEIANHQLTDGIDALTRGFGCLAQTLNLIEPSQLGHNLPHDIIQKIQKVQRYTHDLIKAGESIHETTAREAINNHSKDSAQNIKRIIIRTLNMQVLAQDVRNEADNLIKELEKAQEGLLFDENTDVKQKATAIKMLIEMRMEINKMIVAFQFQDRVSQIINAVINSMKDLTDYISDAGTQARNEGIDAYVDIGEMRRRVEQYCISKEQYELMGRKSSDTSDDIILF
ncbi:MAG: hypothetical protein OEZ43_00755 [Gammaproteobacteria bacterium]|nr:hypothetical protein [Gammaproteobacteria bacterium]